MRILICGAGIAGLTLACLLRQRGLKPDVIERGNQLALDDYVLALYPLGSRVLHGLGAYPTLTAASERLDAYRLIDARGQTIKHFDTRPLAAQHGDIWMTSRRTLLGLLAQQCQSATLRLGTTISALSELPQSLRVRTSDGQEQEYDLVVAADGMHSELRKTIAPKQQTFDTRWACWAWWTERGDFPAATAEEQWGAGRMIGLYPVRDRLGIVAAAPARALGFGAASGRSGHIFEVFGKWGGHVRAVIDRCPDDQAPMFYAKLDDQRTTPWIKNRLVLLGDAACSFLPTAGFGAAMAMESAAVLADELSRVDSRTLPLALKFFEHRRRRRVEAAQDDSRKRASMMFQRNPFRAWARNRSLRMMATDALTANIAAILGEPI